MRRLLLPILLVALAATTTLAGPATASAPASPLPGITDSARLSTPVVASGRVSGTDGTPAAGVPVVIRVWPDSEALGRPGNSPGRLAAKP